MKNTRRPYPDDCRTGAKADWLALDADQRAKFLDRLAFTFSVLHRSKWQHSALYPKHVFISGPTTDASRIPDFQVALIDLEKCRKRWTVNQASRHDLSQFKRHLTGFDSTDWNTLIARYQVYFNHP